MRALKVKSVKPLGIQPVYDVVMPKNHNFILENGAVVHNCSYAIVGYNTAYLKYYYPLEFWTSELTVFSDKEEKLKLYLSFLRDKILQPSISKSHPSDWTIEGDKIRAPLNIIKGLNTCATSISNNAPYTSVSDFAERSNHRSVNRGVFTKLVLAGLFDDVSLDYDQMFQEYWTARKIKEPIPPDCRALSVIERFVRRCELNPLVEDKLSTIVQDRLINSGFTKVSGNINIPFLSPKSNALLADVTVAAKIPESPSLRDRDFFMVALFLSSAVETTKTGKRLLKVKLSDGATEFEAVNWNQLVALRIPKNTVILVKGKIKKGWKVPISISFSTIESLI